MSCPSHSPRRGHSQGGPSVSGFPGCKRRLRNSLSLSGGHTAGERWGGQSPCLLGAPRPGPPQPARKQPSSQQTIRSLWAERPENPVLKPGPPGSPGHRPDRPPLAWKPAYSPGPSLGEDEQVSRWACGPWRSGRGDRSQGDPFPDGRCGERGRAPRQAAESGAQARIPPQTCTLLRPAGPVSSS